MPRRKAVPKSIDTQYFKDVTPLWRPPGQLPIPEKYHDGVLALAEWAGPKWADNDQTDFFLIRTVVIGSCEAWNHYDWEGDEARISQRRVDAKLLPDLQEKASELSMLLERGRFRSIKKYFVLSLLAELGIEPPTSLANVDGILALERTFVRFAERAKVGDQFPFRYGAIEYLRLPDRLPRREVAVALCLADRITFFRKDGHSKGFLDTPHSPNISPNLPWKAIALLASANSDTDNQLDPAATQTLVTSLAKTVHGVFWTS